MGWEIAHDTAGERFIYICTTTGKAFGPYMSDNNKTVQEFYDWWNTVIQEDPRRCSNEELEEIHRRWEALRVETKGVLMVPIEYKANNETLVEMFRVHWESDGEIWKGKVYIKISGVEDKEDPEILHNINDISDMELAPELEEQYYEFVPEIIEKTNFQESLMNRKIEDMEGNGQMNGSCVDEWGYGYGRRIDATGGRPIHWKITEIENGWHSRWGGSTWREVGEDEYDRRYYD